MKTTSIFSYFDRMKWYIRKQKLRARNFLSWSIEPETSMTKKTTALVQGSSFIL